MFLFFSRFFKQICNNGLLLGIVTIRTTIIRTTASLSTRILLTINTIRLGFKSKSSIKCVDDKTFTQHIDKNVTVALFVYPFIHLT